jgi:hypothetical protein
MAARCKQVFVTSSLHLVSTHLSHGSYIYIYIYNTYIYIYMILVSTNLASVMFRHMHVATCIKEVWTGWGCGVEDARSA